MIYRHIIPLLCFNLDLVKVTVFRIVPGLCRKNWEFSNLKDLQNFLWVTFGVLVKTYR